MSDYSDYSSDELLSIRDSLLAEADELLEQLTLLKEQNADSQQIDDVTTQMSDKMTAAQDVEDEMREDAHSVAGRVFGRGGMFHNMLCLGKTGGGILMEKFSSCNLISG